MTTAIAPRFLSAIEPLEARIAPAVLVNPLPDIVAGSGQTGATVDLSKLLDPTATSANRTVVEFITNVDIDLVTPGLQPGKIVLELYDDLAPLTVQNFLAYVENRNAKGDFDNTFFHRLVSGFVLQGGGFEANTPTTHIPTFATVHNEFDGENRSNLRGTVAMAKVGGDPHSATSEWFINLADNSGNLDNQNGGFTVFGEVIEGLNLVDVIAGFSTVNLGGALTNLPVQNYNSDPDNNPATPAPTPTPDQLVRIVETQIVTTPGNAAGVTYAIENITPVGTTSANLLTAALDGTSLNLKYTKGQSGFVDITVKATPADGSDPVFDTFRVDVRPNLIVDITTDNLQGVIVPGDSATVKLELTNNGAATASGTVDVLVGLQKMKAVRNQSGQITGFEVDTAATPITIETLAGVKLNLAGGKAKTFTAKVEIPTFGLAPEDPDPSIDGTVYKLIAQVTPKTGDIALNERFSDDNVEQHGANHQALNRFGSFSSNLGFGSRTNAVLTYTDTDAQGNDTLVSWSMKGPGFGSLVLQAGGGVVLETNGTNATSTLNAKVAKGGGQVAIVGANLTTALGTANLGSINIEDFLFAPAGVRALTLGDVTGQAFMEIGISAPDNSTNTTLKFGRVQDLSLTSFMPVTSFTAIEWLDTAGTTEDSFTALALGSLKITGSKTARGDFEADLTIQDDAATSTLSIAGLLRNSTVQTAGHLGAVTLGGLQSGAVFAGVSERPDTLEDFAEARSIKSFTVRGIKGFNEALFTDAQVAAANIGTVKVQGVATTGEGGAFGLVADAIKSYNRTGGAKLSKLDDPGSFDVLDEYLVQVL